MGYAYLIIGPSSDLRGSHGVLKKDKASNSRKDGEMDGEIRTRQRGKSNGLQIGLVING